LKFIPPAPQLSIRLASPGTAIISWSAGFTGFGLQQNTNPAGTNWLAVTNLPAVISGENRVTISPLPANRFYRLTSP
jgi:hypothetical protein